MLLDRARCSLWDEGSPGSADLLDLTFYVSGFGFHTCLAWFCLLLKYKPSAGLDSAVTKEGTIGAHLLQPDPILPLQTLHRITGWFGMEEI